MTDKTVSPAASDVKRAASELAVGDRIAAKFLPEGYPADVLFVRTYPLVGRRWTFVAYQLPALDVDSCTFVADALIPLAAVADTGMDFSDLADRLNTDGAPVPTTTAGYANGDRSGALVEVHPAEPAAPTAST